MIEVDSVLFMGLLEFVLLLLAIDVVIIVRSVIRRRREKASIDRLVTIVRRDAERRTKETRNLLKKKYGYSGEQLEKATKKIIREEKRIYQILANLFTSRDNIAIENLSITFEEVVEPYRALDVPKLVAENDSEIGGEDNSEEIKRLKAVAKTLNEELEVMMNTIGRMLHEYSILTPDAEMAKMDQDDVIALMGADQESEDVSQTVEDDVPNESVEADVAPQEEKEVEEVKEEEAEDKPSEEAVTEDETLDSVALVGMFQEEDDASAKDAVASVEAPLVEEVISEPELKGDAEKEESAEDSLAQEIGEVLENNDADLSDVNLTEMDAESVEASADPTEELIAQAIGEAEESKEADSSPDSKEAELTVDAETNEVDPTEALIAQAIGEAEASHETPLPEIEEEVLEDEAVASDSVDDLLEQAINQTIESHETALPDMPKEEAVEEPDAEKQLTDEIAETLSSHSETMSSDDIDSLLQGAIEDISEK